ncbi:MAG: plasmid mobilization relaxosome protein MobC [Mesorhizobium sp.]|uniref:plasmid mobilization protein n=1 Tax=Mesorhizobium sp. TaxID=1871066 RepID=UPI000FE6DD26|nr:plasmid mobilization relaxosome protein MobC [Mesorhizobium sp.]RWM09730.1 MAG: plasmid mobilization relaxosome protein MobC [Mesorhizobium sp.]
MNGDSFVVRRGTSRKDKVVRMRLSADELAAIETAAAAADMTMSAFLRSLLLEGAGVQPLLAEEDRAVMGFLADEMRAVGANLNQLARTMSSGRAVKPADVTANIGEVQMVVAAVVAELKALAKRAGYRRRGEG